MFASDICNGSSVTWISYILTAEALRRRGEEM